MGPVDLPPTRWDLGGARVLPGQDVVAVGADLEAPTLVDAYRRGLFPMGGDDPGGDDPLLWFCPQVRGVLLPGAFHESRSLRRSRRAFHVTTDLAFDEVVLGCADPARPHGWITGRYRDAYRRLHDLGWAHSVEVRSAAGDLVGGLYGVQVGALFAGESMFHRLRDASKAALAALAETLGAAYGSAWAVDTQWSTPHLRTLGVVDLPREDYLRLVGVLRHAPSRWPAPGPLCGDR